MSKGLKIEIIIAVIVIVCVVGFLIVRNLGGKSVGIDPNTTNEKGKQGNTSLDSSKVLVVYFSQSGNTQKLAKLISDRVGGDFVRIETVQTYPTEYNELADFAKNERDNNIKPELKDLEIDIDDYDTIFIGAPVWWGDFPMIMYTLFEKVDMNGKRIVPFSTHGGSGLSGFDTKLKRLYPNANVTKGLAITGADAQNKKENVKKEVDNFIESLKLD